MSELLGDRMSVASAQPRCRAANSEGDNRILITECEARGVACYEPVGLGDNQGRENHVIVSVIRYLNVDSGGIDHVDREPQRLGVSIELIVR